jgi:tetratricopeptide (TPR) repeat protein
MGKVFVSYARADKPIVARLVRALRKAGVDPWWDDEIPPGVAWEQTIEQALAEAASAIVCWSPASVASENVRSEARVARKRGGLVQIFLERCDPPLFFGERQGIDFCDWDGSAGAPEIDQLRHALELLGPGIVSPVEREKTTRRRKRSGGTRLALGAGLTALVAASLAGWWWFGRARAVAPARIALQPIEALGSGADLISTALNDQIIAALNDGHIPTITRADSQSLKSGDVDAKLATLGADYSINGTLEAAGGTIHARLHLDDRVRHASLWSYEASGPAEDAAAFNFAAGQAIAGVLSCVYRGLGRNGLTDTDLLSRYVRVCDLFVNHDDASDMKSTFELLGDLRQITAQAPGFAPAHSDFAKFGAYLAPLMPPEQAASIRTEAARHATLALKLDRRSSDAWLAREMLLPPTDWAAREELLRKAVAVNPDWPHSNGFLAMFLQETGRMREAAVYGQRAAAADLQIDWRPYGAQMACDAGEPDSAINSLRERLQIAPGDDIIRYSLRHCLMQAGRYQESKKFERESKAGEISPTAYLNTVLEALVSDKPHDRAKARAIGDALSRDRGLIPLVIQYSAAMGDLDTAFRLASRYTPGYPTTGPIAFLFTPLAAPMRKSPRFFALAKHYGLMDFWRKTGRWPDFCQGARMAECKKLSAQDWISGSVRASQVGLTTANP